VGKTAVPALALALAGTATLAVVAGCSSAVIPAAAPSQLSASMGGNAVTFLRTRATGAGIVVTDGTGYTLYSFSRDTATSSACDSACVPQWPPVTGAPRAAAGVTVHGTLGTIVRDGGVVQATYDGHPLYTFAGDFDPGDVSGDGVTQFGGAWHAVRPAGP
jgi:predicted lipoprotein with Yx(FWY)xxD motif